MENVTERAKRQEALKPDIEKLFAFGESIAHVEFPMVESKEAKDWIRWAKDRLTEVAAKLMTAEL